MAFLFMCKANISRQYTVLLRLSHVVAINIEVCFCFIFFDEDLGVNIRSAALWALAVFYQFPFFFGNLLGDFRNNSEGVKHFFQCWQQG